MRIYKKEQTDRKTNNMNISVVVPYNESESLPELCTWIDKVMTFNSFTAESSLLMMVVPMILGKSLKLSINQILVAKFRRNYGKSSGLNIAFVKAEGNVVITMDADLQDSPDEIPELYHLIRGG